MSSLAKASRPARRLVIRSSTTRDRHSTSLHQSPKTFVFRRTARRCYSPGVERATALGSEYNNNNDNNNCNNGVFAKFVRKRSDCKTGFLWNVRCQRADGHGGVNTRRVKTPCVFTSKRWFGLNIILGEYLMRVDQFFVFFFFFCFAILFFCIALRVFMHNCVGLAVNCTTACFLRVE